MIYKVETIKDGTEKYFFIRNLETMSIEELPSKYLMHKIKCKRSPNGRYMYSEKEIHELRQYFLLSILEHLDLMQLTIFLRRMHGILEMHLLGPIITI